MLRVLEKGPARAYEIEAPLDAATQVGPLEIVPTRCWEPPPEDVPESAAFLVITERDPAGRFAGTEVFRGWMFALEPRSVRPRVPDARCLGAGLPERGTGNGGDGRGGASRTGGTGGERTAARLAGKTAWRRHPLRAGGRPPLLR